MVIRVNESQAPKYNGEVLNRIHALNVQIFCEESTNGQEVIPTEISFDFTFYTLTESGNRLYNKSKKQVLDKCLVDNFIGLAMQKAAHGNIDYLVLQQYVEKVMADVIKDQKRQYSTVNYSED